NIRERSPRHLRIERGDPLVTRTAEDQHFILRIVSDRHPELRPGVVKRQTIYHGPPVGVHLDLEDAVAALHLEEIGELVAVLLEARTTYETAGLRAHPIASAEGRRTLSSGGPYGGSSSWRLDARSSQNAPLDH